MKLIIDIDENDYKYIKEKRAIRNEQMEDIFNGIYCGKPLQAELEEIKFKISKEEDVWQDIGIKTGIELAKYIIDRTVEEVEPK